MGNEIKDFLLSDNCASIEDDMTVVAMFNSNQKADLKDPSYYAEPDWLALEKKWKEKAYCPKPEPLKEIDASIVKYMLLKPFGGLNLLSCSKKKNKDHDR